MENLQKISAKIRGQVVQLSHQAGTPHLGSSLSCVDLMVSIYWNYLNISPETYTDENRDRFILSKGHAITTLYSILSEKGFFDKIEFERYAEPQSPLPEHPSPNCVPGIEAATGSLGHGLSLGLGMALAAKLKKIDYKTYVLLSDGECNEGSTWEAAMMAPTHKLNNLIAIVDFNKWQATGRSSDILSLEPLEKKFEAFGWNAIRIDGHDFSDIKNALDKASSSKLLPTAIIADTVKGKGVKLMEDDNNWHYRIPKEEEVLSAHKELGLIV